MPEEIRMQETYPLSPVPEPDLVLPPRPLIVSVFVGPDGLRAGWRVGMYFAMFFLLSMGLGALIMLGHPKPLPLIWRLFVGECIQLFSAVAPALVMAKIENRPFNQYGLPL